MKTLTFYNEKGGVGKSSHCVLAASYLRYALGKNVVVFDFDAPMFRVYDYRLREQALLADADANRNLVRHLRRDLDPYKVCRISPDGPMNSFTRELVLREIVPVLNNMESSSMVDYVIFDFPGRFDKEDIMATLVRERGIDFVAVPFSTNRASVMSGLYVSLCLRQLGVECHPFFNKLTRAEQQDPGNRFCSSMEDLFRQQGFDVLGTRIKTFNSMDRESSEQFFVQSTFCWPATNVDRLCPELVTLYDEILGMIK